MGMIGAIWGVAGVLLLLGFGAFKLTDPTTAAFAHEFQWYHWVVLIGNTTFVAYFKGYRALHGSLAPRIAARAKYLSEHPNFLAVLLAPLYCMGFFQIVRRKQIVTIMMTLFMVGAIMSVRLLEQPMRGVVDLAVVTSLSWGFVSLILHSVQAFTSESFGHSPQIPEQIPT